MTLRLLVAFVRRDWAVARSYRASFLLQLVSSLGALFVVYYVGRLVDRTPHAEDHTLDKGFFPYVVVGLAVLGVTQSALHSFATRLREEQTTGTLEALLSTPVSPTTVVVGSALYVVLQAVAQAVVLLALATVAGLRPALSPLPLLATLLTGVGLVGLFAAVGVLVAAFTVVVKRGNALAGLVSAALGLFGGVFFPVALLPAPLRLVARAVPFTWGLDTLRESLVLGRVEPARTAGLLACAVVLLPLAAVVFLRAVDRARRDGSLAQF